MRRMNVIINKDGLKMSLDENTELTYLPIYGEDCVQLKNDTRYNIDIQGTSYWLFNSGFGYIRPGRNSVIYFSIRLWEDEVRQELMDNGIQFVELGFISPNNETDEYYKTIKIPSNAKGVYDYVLYTDPNGDMFLVDEKRTSSIDIYKAFGVVPEQGSITITASNIMDFLAETDFKFIHETPRPGGPFAGHETEYFIKTADFTNDGDRTIYLSSFYWSGSAYVVKHQVRFFERNGEITIESE